MLFVHRGKHFEFKTDFVGMKFSFHAVNPAYSLIDDSQRDFFMKSSEFIPKRIPKVSLTIQKNAHLAIFSALSTKSLDTKAPDLPRVKPERIKIEPLIINVSETVANEKFLFRFTRITAKHVKVSEIIALQKKPTPHVVVQSKIKKSQLTSDVTHSLSPPQPSVDSAHTDKPLADSPLSEKAQHLGLNEKERVITSTDDWAGQRSTDEVPSFEGSSTENNYPKIITGRLDLMDGAHVGPDANIVVYREYQGRILEGGSVDIQKGFYTIHAENTKGRVVAEVRHPSLGVLARGYGNLSVAENTSAQEKVITAVDVKLGAIRQGLSAQVTEPGSFKSNKSVPGALVSIMGFDLPKRSVADGTLENEIFTGASQYLLYSQKEGFSPTLSYGRSEFVTDLPMYSLSYLADLYRLAFNQDLSNSRASIYGRIVKNGKPQARSTVEVLNETNYKVIYLDDRGWPNPDLLSSSKHGGYFILGLNAGLAAVRAKHNDGYSEVKVLPADFSVVTKLDLELSRTLKATLSVYDAQSPQTYLESKIKTFASSVLGVESTANQSTQVIFAKGDDPLFVEIDTQPDYLPLTLTLKRTEGDYSVPAVRRSWIDNIHQKFRVPALQNRGVVIGYLDHAENFEVLLDQFNPSVGETLYYFDQNGDIIPQILSAQNAVGYIILNAQEGVRNILLRNMTTGLITADTAYVEAGVGSLLVHEI